MEETKREFERNLTGRLLTISLRVSGLFCDYGASHSISRIEISDRARYFVQFENAVI
jgi:hypothetical protein